SLRSSCVGYFFNAHDFGVELPELEVLEVLEVLELEVLELLLELVLLEGLRPLVLEVLVPGALELLGLVVLRVLELETLRSLEQLALEALELEELELEALAQDALELPELELEALEPEALELQVLEVLTLALEELEALCGREHTSFPCFSGFLQASPLPAPSPYIEQSGGLTERHEPASCPVLPVRTARPAPCLRPPPVPGTHAMALRPSSVPLRVPLPTPPESSLLEAPNPKSDRPRASSPAVSRLFATDVTNPSFESAAASALVADLLDFADACRLDYATALVAESMYASPPSVGGESGVLECLAAAVPRFASMLLAPEGDLDASHIPSPRSYAEAMT
ncbi:unnamed protein product, partial [Closterium sp. NIES-54]